MNTGRHILALEADPGLYTEVLALLEPIPPILTTEVPTLDDDDEEALPDVHRIDLCK